MARREQKKSAAAGGASVEDGGLWVVKLTEARLNSKGQTCAAGTVISPNVEGWPEHRVNFHLQHGYAAPAKIDAPSDGPAEPGATQLMVIRRQRISHRAERSTAEDESAHDRQVTMNAQDEAAPAAGFITDAQGQE